MIKRDELARRALVAAIAFDREMCLAEARNAERLMLFYLGRCDDVDTARELAGIFAGLAERCRAKVRKLGASGETGV